MQFIKVDIWWTPKKISVCYLKSTLFTLKALFANVQIIVLENGKVIEQGPHEVLLSKAGRYAQLWGQQNNSIDAIDTAINAGA